jgi:8-oxo-dGTP pyrophosphatase MutT (NUDIX family)
MGRPYDRRVPPTEVAVPHPAATVIVLRDTDDGLATLLLQREDRGAFAGLWVFPGGRVDDVDLLADAPADELAAARRAAAREAMEEAGVNLEPATLVPFAHWMPPETSPKRFSTWFFVGVPSQHDVVVDGAEIHDHRWLRPVDALDQHAVGSLGLAPPTWVTLHQLVAYERAADVVADAVGRMPERFATRPLQLDGGAIVLTWHGDAAYETGVDGPGPRHRLLMEDGRWSYVRSR